jgi:hypothetical protein
VIIKYPVDWEVEEFAYNERHLPGIHPGHLPGLPIQVLQPSQLDMLQQGSRPAIVGFYSPTGDQEPYSAASVMIFVEKVGVLPSLFSDTLDDYVKSYIIKNIEIKYPAEGDNPKNTIIASYDSSIAAGKARTLLTEKSWGWNDETGEYEHSEKIMTVFTLKEDRIYTLEYSAFQEDYDKYLPPVEAMFASFQTPSPSAYKQLVGMAVLLGISSTIVPVVIKAKRSRNSTTALFLSSLRMIFPAALGIEILCIASAEIGGNFGLYLFGFNLTGFGLSYALVYGLAGFTTFSTILGRLAKIQTSHDHGHESGHRVTTCDCRSVLEHGSNLSFYSSLKTTLGQFIIGLKTMAHLHRKDNVWPTLKTSLVVLVTAESGCILTAATVDLLLYQYSLIISIPLSLLAGTLAVAGPQALKIAKSRRAELHSSENGNAQMNMNNDSITPSRLQR